MVHLIVHLVREIRLCGPVYLRWMYPVEQYMKILKGYMKNQNRPKASIVEKYIAEEAIEFCSDYMSEADAIGIPKSRHGGRCGAESMHFSSSKDKNPILASISYYGIIEEIWDVDFITFKVPLFKCKWIDTNNGVKTDDFGFTLVDLAKLAYTNEPFIMSSQAKQVFYVSDPSNNSNKKWSVVLQGKTNHGPNDSQDATLHIYETPSFSQRVPNLVEDTIVDEVHATREDHEEGIWEEET
ncbi:hypothetical protein TSUD_326190 [Trifolium subterraneum]|uniref:DUF4218 domain-containing protein n=1 Tax=Trifolium subterraneum TaxID=3900 RepID=A0A2Z6MKT2_TRISU|nr:hypothetical protein TSUD_326190 [Trifolium subterraneum]